MLDDSEFPSRLIAADCVRSPVTGVRPAGLSSLADVKDAPPWPDLIGMGVHWPGWRQAGRSPYRKRCSIFRELNPAMTELVAYAAAVCYINSSFVRFDSEQLSPAHM